jgi:hypothetical protein
MANLTAQFTRIGKAGACFQWQEYYQESFQIWHQTTKWSRDQERLPIGTSTRRRILWGKSRKTIGWQHFDEGALASNGDPKLICQRCSGIVKHPNDGVGTSGMDSHLKSSGCRSTAKFRGLPERLNLKGFLQTVLP